LVVTAIFPVAAPVGTSAVTSVSEITVKVADFPSNVTFVVCFRPVPLRFPIMELHSAVEIHGFGHIGYELDRLFKLRSWYLLYLLPSLSLR
jgi:hypothetical protein